METTKILWRKKELVYGEDATPTAAANAALTRNFTTKPVVTDRIQRNLDRAVRGRAPDAPSNERQTFSYELELAGSGAAGTAAPWMEDLEACGMAAPVLTAETDAVQKFAAIGTALSSMTAYHWHGTMRRRAVGARGTFGWDVTAGQYPFVKLDMTGMLLLPTPIDSVAPAAPDLSRWQDPVEVNTDNTDFTLDGFALVLKSFTGDVNAEIAARNLVGARYIQRGNHAITGRIVGEVPDLGAKNYFDTLRSGAEIAVNLTHGTVAGNIVEFAGAHLQITDIDLSEENDVLMLTLSYGLNVGTTPDDLIITAK
ncbi:MAG TPA: phage tail tube protein [Sphingomonas sp.]|nr:phage tail tube protein [Sphingomonas sp.]